MAAPALKACLSPQERPAMSRMLSLLSVLCLVVSASVAGGSDADLLLRVLETMAHRSQRSDDASTTSCSARSNGGRDPAETMTLSQSTLDNVNDFLANSLKAPINLLGLSIPTLDPWTVDNFDVSGSDETLGEVALRVAGMKITDLSTVQLSSVKLNVLEPPLNFQIGLGVKDVEVRSSDYSINLNISNTFSLYGSGAMWFQAYGIKLYADIDLNEFSFSSIHINELTLSMEKFQSYFQNLMGGGETGALINDVVNDIMPDLAQGLADVVKNMVNRNGQSANNASTTTSSLTTEFSSSPLTESTS